MCFCFARSLSKCGDARIRTWVPGFGDQSPTAERHPRILFLTKFVLSLPKDLKNLPGYLCLLMQSMLLAPLAEFLVLQFSFYLLFVL